jgi:NADPH:quinone reductase-like Zn-dependent oxidoreductase
MTSYRCVVATRRGGPEVLQVVERELRDHRPDEIRVRVQAASVSLVDVQARQGRGPRPLPAEGVVRARLRGGRPGRRAG